MVKFRIKKLNKIHFVTELVPYFEKNYTAHALTVSFDRALTVFLIIRRQKKKNPFVHIVD